MKTLKKVPRKPNPHAKKIVVTIKVNAEEMKQLLFRAHGFTKGNVSAWIRYAAFNFKPKKEDFES